MVQSLGFCRKKELIAVASPSERPFFTPEKSEGLRRINSITDTESICERSSGESINLFAQLCSVSDYPKSDAAVRDCFELISTIRRTLVTLDRYLGRTTESVD